MTDEFLSQTELGQIFGVSSHRMGKWLVDLGLRYKNKKPSRPAFENGFVHQRGLGKDQDNAGVGKGGARY